MKATAKHDVKVLIEDNRFSSFKEGKEYRCMMRGENIVWFGSYYKSERN